jgi:SSS family solute:Na+ symporter
VLARYREAGIVSVYEVLEQRIHVSARLIGSVSFILLAIGRMGVILYLPALAFSTATGAPLIPCIIVMGVIVTAYTVVGGMEAVVWTDAIQVVIFVAGALLTLGFILADLGLGTFIEVARAEGKFAVIIPGAGLREIVTIWLVLETIFQTIRIYGTQQEMVQRYMTTESVAKANRSVWISVLAYIPLGAVFYLIGTALFVFYRVHPDPALPAKADSIYPYFIVTRMPPGVAGLVVAAIFAAAMSSIDSLMNSGAAVCVEDFVRRFSKRERSDEQYLKLARRLTILAGGIAIVMALASSRTEYVQLLWGKVMAVATNGILGLMALAFLPFRVDWRAAVVGFVCASLYLVLMMCSGIVYLLWPVVGNTVCFVVALAANSLIVSPEEGA